MEIRFKCNILQADGESLAYNDKAHANSIKKPKRISLKGQLQGKLNIPNTPKKKKKEDKPS